MAEQSIDSLILTDTYNPAIIPKLEEHLKRQIKGEEEYHFLVNKTLLKQYQFFPDLCNVENVKSILTLSIVALPEQHFNLFCFIIPEEVLVGNSEVAALVKLNNFLESCDFKEFWKHNKTLETDSQQNFTLKVRGYILKVLSLTFKSCPFSVLLTSLDFASKSEVETFCKSHSLVQEVTPECLIFLTNSSNQPIKKIVKDGIVAKNLSVVMRN